MGALMFGAVPLACAAGLFVGIVLGMVLGARFAGDDLRSAQSVVVGLRDQLLAAGIWPDGAPEHLRPKLATPPSSERR
jgi:hypothetical protein